MRSTRLFAEVVGVLVLGMLVHYAPSWHVSFPCAALLLLWLPGRSMLRLLRGLDARAGRFWHAAAISIAVVPVPLSWIWRFSNDATVLLAWLAVGGMVTLGVALMGVQAHEYYLMSQRFTGGLTVDWPHFPRSLFGRSLSPGPIANLLNAPWVWLIDFGLTGVACVLVTRRFWSSLWRDPGMRMLIVTGGSGTVFAFVIRSNVNSIDYGLRSAIVPMMVVGGVCAGALFVGHCVRPIAMRWRYWIIGAFALPGCAVGLYEAPMTAIHPLIDTEPRYELYHVPRFRTALMLLPFDQADAGAIRYLRHQSPVDAVVQGDPEARLMLPQLIDRQMGVVLPPGRGGAHVRVLAPLDVNGMERARADALDALSTPSSRQAYDLLRALGVTHVLAGCVERARFDSDLSQFYDETLFEPVYEDDHAAVYRLVEDATGGRP